MIPQMYKLTEISVAVWEMNFNNTREQKILKLPLINNEIITIKYVKRILYATENVPNIK